MKKAILLWITLVLLMPLSTHLSLAWADDGFYVIPFSAALTTKIKSVPTTISSPGFYYLADSLSYGGTGNAIQVDANDVTIDLMGHNILSTGAGSYRYGIYMHGRKNVEIRNGTLTNFVVGVKEDDATGLGHTVSNIRTLGSYVGISLSGTNHKVLRCTASNNISDGIFVNEGIVSGCTTQGGNNRGIDIVNGLIENCYCVGNRICFQIYAGAAIGNVGLGCTDYGFVIGSSALPLLMDQNSVSGSAGNYSGGTPESIAWGINAGR